MLGKDVAACKNNGNKYCAERVLSRRLAFFDSE